MRKLPDLAVARRPEQRLWPHYLACLLSFLVIARFWVTHHVVFRLILRSDATLVWLNLLMFMFVAFLPFPTGVLGQHRGSPAAGFLYAASVCLAGRHACTGTRPARTLLVSR